MPTRAACDETWLDSGIVLPSEDFESYGGDDAALDAIYDHFGTILDNTPGDPYTGEWCGKFISSGGSRLLFYPKGTGFSGTGLAEKVFDVTFYMAHNAPRLSGGASTWEQPPAVGSIPEKGIFRLYDGAGNAAGAYFAVTTGGWNCCVVSEATGLKYTTPIDSLPGNGAYHKVRVRIEFESSPGATDGNTSIWIDGVLQRSATGIQFGPSHGTYAATYGGIGWENAGGAGFTAWRLDDVNLCDLLVAARARQWEIA